METLKKALEQHLNELKSDYKEAWGTEGIQLIKEDPDMVSTTGNEHYLKITTKTENFEGWVEFRFTPDGRILADFFREDGTHHGWKIGYTPRRIILKVINYK